MECGGSKHLHWALVVAVATLRTYCPFPHALNSATNFSYPATAVSHVPLLLKPNEYVFKWTKQHSPASISARPPPRSRKYTAESLHSFWLLYVGLNVVKQPMSFQFPFPSLKILLRVVTYSQLLNIYAPQPSRLLSNSAQVNAARVLIGTNASSSSVRRMAIVISDLFLSHRVDVRVQAHEGDAPHRRRRNVVFVSNASHSTGDLICALYTKQGK